MPSITTGGCQQEAIRRPRAGQALPQAEVPHLPVDRAGSRGKIRDQRPVRPDRHGGWLTCSHEPSDCRRPSLREMTICRELPKADGSITLRKMPVKIRSSPFAAKSVAGPPDSLNPAFDEGPLLVARIAASVSCSFDAVPDVQAPIDDHDSPQSPLPAPSGVPDENVQK